MSNSLGGDVTLFTKRLDKIIAQEAKTGFLTINDEFLGEFTGVGEVKLPTIVTQGLGDYSRSNGFPAGDVTLTWQSYKLRYDRGRDFSIDAMDDEEHELLVSANVMAEFVRTKVIPEVDALRFALLAEGAGHTESEALTTKEAALAAVLEAETYFEDLGYDVSDLTLNLTAGVKKLLREAQPWSLVEPGGDPNTNFGTFDGMKLNVIPQARFYTAIDLYDGTSVGETAGGYVKHVSTGGTDAAGKNINFLIAAPGSATAIQKHETLRHFEPEVNQAKDAHLWQYRLFHDLLVYEKKKALIYANVATS